MPKFELCCLVTVSAYTTVEAKTLEEAIEIAEARHVELSFNGSGNSEHDVWLIEEADGCPQDIQER